MNLETLMAQGPVDVNVSRCTVRVKTTVWADKRGLHTKKSLTFLRRQCEGFNVLAEDASATGAEEVFPRILNLGEVEDGIYEVVVCNESHDYETGYVDDYDYRLVTRKARHEAPAKEKTVSEEKTIEAGNSLPQPLGSAAFSVWSEARGVWPRLTHEEIFRAGWDAAIAAATAHVKDQALTTDEIAAAMRRDLLPNKSKHKQKGNTTMNTTMKMTERYADSLQAREIITDFIKWAKHKPFTEATLDEYFGIDRAALEAEAKDATSGTTLDKGN